MNISAILNKLLRVTLSLSFILTTPGLAFAADSNGLPTKTGGTKQPPPNYPPVTYFNGGGQNDGRPRSIKSNPDTFEVYMVDPKGNSIFFEGQKEIRHDSYGKEITYHRVFQFLDVSAKRVGSEIHRGILTDARYLDSQKITWSPNVYSLGEMMLEIAVGKAKQIRKVLNVIGPVNHAAKAFEVYSIAPDHLDVFFEGSKDKEGRERIFRETLNSAFLDRGYIANMETGEVVWTARNVPRHAALDEIAKVILNEAPKMIVEALGQHVSSRDQFTDLNGPRHGKNYPSYPEQPAANKDPLPRERSLVITEHPSDEHSPYQRMNPAPSGSGQIEISSPYRVKLTPELSETYSPQWQAGRPSQLGKTLDWVGESGVRLQSSVRDYFQDGGFDDHKEKVTSGTAEFARISISFYMAMGILAASELAMNYSSDPRAWTAFLESGTDPVFYLSFGAFLLAAQPFYKNMGPLGSGPVMSVLPRFTGAIVFGGIASQLVAGLLNDPNFRKCYGFASYKESGKFVRDLAACDKLYDKYANYRLDQELLPLISNLVASSLMFYGSYRLLGLVSSRLSASSIFGPLVRVFKVPPTSLRDPRAIGLMVAFLAIYEVSDFLPFGRWLSELFITDNPNLQYPLRASYDLLFKGEIKSYSKEYGNSIQDSETKLLTEWKRNHDTDWQNPNLWKKVCVDTKRNEQVAYNCDAPDHFDFDAVLKRYGEWQSKWRDRQMDPTSAAFNSWSKKVHAYNGTIAAAYTFYKNIVNKKQFATQHGWEPYLGKRSAEVLRTGINKVGRPLNVDYSQAWSTVIPRDFYDFMITSMACGPEAEKFGQPGAIGSVYNYFFASSPTQMAKNSMWSDIQFFPPKITEPLPGNSSVCDKPYEGYTLPVLPKLGPRGLYTIEQFPYLKNDKYARGLDRFVMDNIRSSILDESSGGFDVWWIENVLNPNQTLQQEFRKEYEKMLNNKYLPALLNKDYKHGWCELPEANLRIPSLAKHLRDLGKGADCQSEATHRLAFGIFNSLKDELRLYSALMLDLFESVPKVSGGKYAQLDGLRLTLTEAAQLLEQMQIYLSTLDKNKRPNLKQMENQFKIISQTLLEHSKSLIANKDAGWKAQNEHIPLWTTGLQAQVESVFFQALEYTKILTNFEISAGEPRQ